MKKKESILSGIAVVTGIAIGLYIRYKMMPKEESTKELES